MLSVDTDLAKGKKDEGGNYGSYQGEGDFLGGLRDFFWDFHDPPYRMEYMKKATGRIAAGLESERSKSIPEMLVTVSHV